jgi:hypothetical protein
MESLMIYATIASASLIGATILALITLKGFNAWLDLKRAELAPRDAAPITAGQRIDIADLKERIRKLEAIAAGVDI